MTTRYAGALAILIAVAAALWWVLRDPTQPPSGSSASQGENGSSFVMPALDPLAARGRDLFTEFCARCHGENALGSDRGPPLVHDIYNPGHHPDEAFYRAVQFGVRQHHWRFGDMPALRDQVSPEQVRAIIAFIRRVQRANGVVARPHRMGR